MDYHKDLMTELQEKTAAARREYYATYEKLFCSYIGEKHYNILKEIAEVLLTLRGFTNDEYTKRTDAVRAAVEKKDTLAESFLSSYGLPYWIAVEKISERLDNFICEFCPEMLPTLIIKNGSEETRIKLL